MPVEISDSCTDVRVDRGSEAPTIGGQVLPIRSARHRNSDTSVGKALALLDVFAGPRAVLGVSELAERTGLPKSTAHRLLMVLLGHGYLRRRGDRFALADHVFELGQQTSFCRPNGLRELALPFMSELYAETRDTVHLAVLRGSEVLYLEKLFGHRAGPCPTKAGMRMPAYCTALGKAMLAYSDATTQESVMSIPIVRRTPYTISNPTQLSRSLQRVRSDGFATDLEESHVGITCLAVPLRDRAGKVTAALSISSITPRGDIRRHAARLLRTGEEIASRLQPSTVG